MTTAKEEFISRVLSLSPEKSSELRRGKVETREGKIIYLDEDVLKARYPEKVIEYYEQKLKSKAAKYD